MKINEFIKHLLKYELDYDIEFILPCDKVEDGYVDLKPVGYSRSGVIGNPTRLTVEMEEI